MEAIILAGGFGRRLKNKLKNIPKPMVPINRIPFLDYILRLLKNNGIERVIISVYYKSDIIIKRYNNGFDGLKIVYSRDNSPLGSGGAIKAAINNVKSDNVFIVNGDTFFNIVFEKLFRNQLSNNNDITIALKTMFEFDRYGFVKTKNDGRIISFEEKKYQKSGKIDGGVYVIKKDLFHKRETRDTFLFGDFINNNFEEIKIGSITFDSEFLDIGTPEDLSKAPSIMKKYFNPG